MNRDDILRMAQEAGLHRKKHNLIEQPWAVQHRYSYDGYEENLERFYHLAYAAGEQAEREACAKVCEQIDTAAFRSNRPEANDCAAAIRARGEKK